MSEDGATVAAASRRCGEKQSRDGSATIGYFDPDAPIEFLSGDLPHWRQERVTYFVSFRLGDSLPQDKLQTWCRERDLWMQRHPAPHSLAERMEYYRLFPQRMQDWIDAGAGSCVLAIPAARKIVADALEHFTVAAASRRGDRARYQLDEHVVAPNHVHAILTPHAGFELSSILHSWKSYTSHELLKIPEVLERTGMGKGKTAAGRRCHSCHSQQDSPRVVWQKETFDHIVRSPGSLERFREYVREHRMVER